MGQLGFSEAEACDFFKILKALCLKLARMREGPRVKSILEVTRAGFNRNLSSHDHDTEKNSVAFGP